MKATYNQPNKFRLEKQGVGANRVLDPYKPMVALTFDDGPSPLYTPVILDVLDEHNSAATFFVLGTEADRNRELLAEIIQRGNEIGNHSLNHRDFTKLSIEELNYQINTTQDIIEEATGYAPLVLRTPYGFVNVDLMKELHMPVILWSLDTRDWESRDPEKIYDEVFENVKDGDIILMHDIYESSAEAVKQIIPELIERGFQVVSVSELSRLREVPLQAGNIYSNLY
ncbi:polysaccharide deacetylase family protein [Sinanaerobacter chloroacetimidivorans]|uniref:Polysaccharide deacetylase family protein n=1 Tax=Sinanaerobacter chloroacetimidivorans TaxID=2818044 RepID=A0A8J8B440_9FIRM|nr:polysaccharide deacetylase family protein [Sinanaerobacter chloroacetimidivorans]MBR0598945.1 polysaccharide deacetylase family protein [Sinanaerobacter chloroacetimidivorans]